MVCKRASSPKIFFRKMYVIVFSTKTPNNTILKLEPSLSMQGKHRKLWGITRGLILKPFLPFRCLQSALLEMG